MDYETQLAQWKSKHGLDAKAEINQDELRMAAEEQASKKLSWCVVCGKEMPIAKMKLMTRAIDPYAQIDESPGDYIAKAHRVRMCPECFDERYRTED